VVTVDEARRHAHHPRCVVIDSCGEIQTDECNCKTIAFSSCARFKLHIKCILSLHFPHNWQSSSYRCINKECIHSCFSDLSSSNHIHFVNVLIGMVSFSCEKLSFLKKKNNNNNAFWFACILSVSTVVVFY